MHRHATGIHRRELLQVGFTGLFGLSWANGLGAAPARNSNAKRKSVIVVFLTGAASHIDTFDVKPDAPAEIRGEFASIPSTVPGYRVCEHLPLLAKRTQQYAILRTLAHKDNNHTAATHHILTGSLQPGVRFDKPLSRDDWPVFASGVAMLKPPADGVPSGVTLPTFLQEGPLVWPGQHAGFLGPKYDPWQITRDPNQNDFQVENTRLAPGLEAQQLSDRMALLEAVSYQQVKLAESLEARRLGDQQRKAAALLTTGAVAKAFDLKQETAANRDRYGRHMFGQSLLLAKRLVAAGVPVVQANMGRVQNWDTHGNNFARLKKDLLPPLDQGVSALLDELKETGLHEDVMVVVIGDFGREPNVNKNAGREHWAPCFSALFAGAGVRGGQIIGKSDRTGAYPSTTPYSPDDVGATIYHVLGIDPHTEVRDRQDRPVQLNRGNPIQTLFGA
jgi:hypothetical protein